MLQLSDNRRRFVMPKDAPIGPNTAAEVEVLADGRVMITPVLTVPIHEAWALTPESRARTAASEKAYREDRTIGAEELDILIAERLKREKK